MKTIVRVLLTIVFATSIVACGGDNEKDVETSSVMIGSWMDNGYGVVAYNQLDFAKNGIVRMFRISNMIEIENEEFNFVYIYDDESKMLRMTDSLSGAQISFAVTWISENEYKLAVRSCDDVIKHGVFWNFFNTSQWKSWYRK